MITYFDSYWLKNEFKWIGVAAIETLVAFAVGLLANPGIVGFVVLLTMPACSICIVVTIVVPSYLAYKNNNNIANENSSQTITEIDVNMSL